MDWVFVCLALTPMVFCPRFLFNGFALPQTLAVSLLSAASVAMGVWRGSFYLSAPVCLIFAFLVYTFLTALRTDPAHNAKKELGLQVPLLLLFLTLPAYVDVGTVRTYVVACSLACFLICTYAIAQTMNFDPFFSNKIKRGGPTDNAIGTVGNPNFLSSYLSGTFWLTVYAGTCCHRAFFAVSVVVLFTLYKTRSRAGQLAVVSSAVFFGLCLARQGMFAYSNYVFYPGIFLVIAFVALVVSVLVFNWEKFWRSKIDPNAEKRVWFASFRYRLCFWLVALYLIKKRWLLGWGLWSYRKEVYQGQAELNDRYPGFMDGERYVTPQPRECHNDWLEHVFEYGVLGAGLFFAFVGMVVFNAFGAARSSIFDLLLLTNLVSILVNAAFFFALRIPSTAVQFWVTMVFLSVLSGRGEVLSFSVSWWAPFLLTVLMAIFVWECVVKRVIASRYFIRAMYANGMKRYELICEAITWAPHDTMLRTHAAMATADYAPIVANIHAQRMIDHFDGQITQWAVVYNYVLTRLKGYRAFFDVATHYLKQGHYLLNYFKPINQLLRGRESISLKSQYTEGAEMREIGEAQLWKIRTFISNMDALGKETVILQKEAEAIQLKIQSAQQQVEIAKGKIENAVLYEKKRMNIPDNWIFIAEEGVFRDPAAMSEEERKKYGLEG